MTVQSITIEELSINTIRTLSIDAVEKANSGHPGLPMGSAPMAYELWTKFIHINPANPHWINQDRFVLSVGHGSMLLYHLLPLSGYDLLPELGIDMDKVTQQLEQKGVEKFNLPFDKLMETLAQMN